ncbi:MAG: YcaO-like family protein [Bacteroidota bacterium]
MDYTDHYVSDSIKDIANWIKSPLSPIKMGFCRKTMRPEPEWWVASYKLGNNPIGLFHSKRMAAAAGTSIFAEEAINKAVGEAAERYSSLNAHYVDQFETREIDNTGRTQFVRCAPFEPCQDSYKPMDKYPKPVEHTQVTRLTTGEKHWVPVEQVHLGYTRYDFSLMHTPPISTGCAFFFDTNVAIWKGLCEVIERDAMMRFWQMMKKPTEVMIDDCKDYRLQLRLKRINDAGLRLKIFQISEVVEVPTLYAILSGDTYPYFCIGASANADIIKACTKAIDEVMSIRMMAIWNGFKNEEELNFKDFSWVDQLETHMELYANWKDSPAFDFFIHDSPKVTLKELMQQDWIKEPQSEKELKEAAAQIESKGFTVMWKDITIPEVAPYGKVVKVLVPEMIPLSQNFNARWLNGLIDSSKDPSELNINPFPHPFS